MLFVTRARQVDASFIETEAVENLCRRLDELPLALELAAARTAVFSVEQLLERLGQRLDLLKGGRDADPRQATLRATIMWSFELLQPEEQLLFTRLAAFVGGCTLEAAEVACDADLDTLQSLIDKSLVRRREGAGGERYWMLETIREFAAEQLEASAEADHVRLRHAQFVAAFTEQADPHVRRGPDQDQWGDRIAEDYGNVRAAMRFSLDHAPELALRIVGSLPMFLWMRGGFLEALAWVDQSLAAAPTAEPRLLGRAHECGALVAERLGDFETETRHADAAYAASSKAGDGFGIANALREQGKAAIRRGDRERARGLYEELAAFSEQVGDDWNAAIALNNLGDLALFANDWESVVELCGRSFALRVKLGDGWGAALARTNVAMAELKLGRLEASAASLRFAMESSLQSEALMVFAACIDTCVLLAATLGNLPEAAGLLGATARLHDELGSVRDDFEDAQVKATAESVRTSLGDNRFDDEFERGRAHVARGSRCACVRAI